ncbi:hypothetical protein ACWIGI_28825 [Nocardia sp. NPDC055321]
MEEAPRPKAIDEDALKVLLGMYASERSDGASLMSAGFAQVAAMLAYVGVVTTLVAREPPPSPFAVLAAPIPALLLLLTYTVHSFVQGIRATSAMTLERLLHFSLDAFAPAQPLLINKPKMLQHQFSSEILKDLRLAALGLHSTETFFNDSLANKRHGRVMRFYYVLAMLIVLGFAVVLDVRGFILVWHTEANHFNGWMQFVAGFEIAAAIVLGLLAAYYVVAGAKHRGRAQEAGRIVIQRAAEAVAEAQPPDPTPT